MRTQNYKGDRAAGLTAYEKRILDAAEPSYPTAYEIAARADASPRGVYGALERLEARGLVSKIEARNGSPAARWKVL